MVDAVVPVAAGQAAGIGADARVEARVDVDVAGVEVEAGQRVGQRRVVPGGRLQGTREVAEDEGGAGRAEGARGGRAGERGEARTDVDRLRAVERAAPQVGGEEVDVDALVAEGGARVAAQRCHRRRVVEAGARGIEVDEDDVRRRGGGRPAGEDEDGEQHEGGAADGHRSGRAGHGHFSSPAAAGVLRICRSAWTAPSTQVNEGWPAASRRATE